MGCSNSKVESEPQTEEADDKKEPLPGPLSDYEIDSRTVAHESPEPCSIVDSLYQVAYTLEYGCVSQRGYYPQQLTKANQDSWVCSRLLGDPNSYIFGVFDGHGGDGDHCATFASRRLPGVLEKELSGELEAEARSIIELYDPRDSKSTVERCFERSFTTTNSLMHRANFDTKLSGSTAVCCFVVGSTLFIGNVGDSRAIIAHAHPDHPDDEDLILVSPLTLDQTPYRKDERERVKQYGARIMTVDQLEGREPIHENWGTRLGDEIDEYGDPPRVWNASLDRPGCAFTRSFGDLIAERLGVVADPEMAIHQLGPLDRFLVIASDGVWEFLTSQAVADMVNRLRKAGSSPQESCRKIVSEAYRLWLQYEVRSDDITMICLYFDKHTVGGPAASEVLQTSLLRKRRAEILGEARVSSPALTHRRPKKGDVKPVRRVLGKEKRLYISSSASSKLDPKEVVEFQANLGKYRFEKTDAEKKRIEKMMMTNYLFINLSHEKLTNLISVMRKETINLGETVMRSGDEGDKFYVIDSGKYDVFIDSDEQQKVHTYTQPGESFGELSLLYGKPRAATITCCAEGEVWSLARLAFRATLMDAPSHGSLIKILAKVSGFEGLSVPQLQRISDNASSELFEDGRYIIRQGEVGDAMYIISEGTCVCTKTLPEGEVELVRIGESSFFGERALIRDEPRAANVRAAGEVRVVRIKRRIFREVSESLAGTLSAEHQCRVEESKRAELTLREEASHHVSTFNAETGYMSEIRVIDEKAVLGTVASSEWLGPEISPAYCAVAPSNNATWIGVFGSSKNEQLFSVRQRGVHAVLDDPERLLREREILTTIQHGDAARFTLLPHVTATMVDSRAVSLCMREQVVCDLHGLLENDFDNAALAFAAACLTDALHFCHDKELLVRSVTSEGALVRSDGYVMLGDLTEARYVRATGPNLAPEKAYTMCGDMLYFAPEVISAGGYGPKADLWALGVLIYEMHTAKMPFGAPGDPETRVYQSIAQMQPDYPPEAAEPMGEVLQTLLSGRLLVAENRRSTTADLPSDPFFADVDWPALEARTAPSPLLALCEQTVAAKAAESDNFTRLRTEFDASCKPAPNSRLWALRSY